MPSIVLSTKTEVELEDMANDMGKTLYTNWKKDIRGTEFKLIRSMFNENGDILSILFCTFALLCLFCI